MWFKIAIGVSLLTLLSRIDTEIFLLNITPFVSYKYWINECANTEITFKLILKNLIKRFNSLTWGNICVNNLEDLTCDYFSATVDSRNFKIFKFERSFDRSLAFNKSNCFGFTAILPLLPLPLSSYSILTSKHKKEQMHSSQREAIYECKHSDISDT